MGLTFKDVRLIVITHAHVDHAGNAARLRELSGAPIVGHVGDLKHYRRDVPMAFCPTGWAGRLFLKTPLIHEPYTAFEPDILLSGNCTLDLGGYLQTPFISEMSAIQGAGYEFHVLKPSEVTGTVRLGGAIPSMLRGKSARVPLLLDFQNGIAPRRLAGWMLFVGGIALVSEMGVSYNKLHHEREAILTEARVSKLRLDLPREASAARRFSSEDLVKAHQIVSRLSTPWDEFFAGLEAVSNKNAAILTIEPDVQTGSLRIAASAGRGLQLRRARSVRTGDQLHAAPT